LRSNFPWFLLGIATVLAMVVVLVLITPREKPRVEVRVQTIDVPDSMPRGIIFVPEEHQELLAYWCDKEGVPYAIMARVAFWESGWDPNADNGEDCGLFQLNRKYFNWFSFKFNDNRLFDPFNGEESTKIACRYMRWLYRQTGDYRMAVMAYNCGLTRLKGKGPPKSTVRYMHLVFGD